MRTIAVIQARMGSSRLPGKVLADIAGRPMIAHVVERANRIQGVDGVAVAIPDLPDDDPLAAAVEGLGVPLVRGPADDVLGRFALAVQATGADRIVRLTADCPLLSPTVSSSVVAALDDSTDYASNTLDRTWPRGLDTEAITADALRVAGHEARDPVEREHVTPFIWRRPDRFRLRSVLGPADQSQLRWTVDTAVDLALIREIHAELGPEPFDLDEILALLERLPHLATLNASVAQKHIGQ